LLGAVCLAVLAAVPAGAQQGVAGYSEYFIPGGENEMSLALRSMNETATPGTNTHAVISITAWADNTVVYYDHWEDGIDFDPNNPAATADETFVLGATGSILVLDDTPTGGIPVPRNSANTYYDGGDRIYVAGGAVTVTRSAWLEARGLQIQAVAWEIYPVKPQLTTYVLPFGQNLSGSFPDFLRTYVLIQATANNTTFTVDLNGDGTADPLDVGFDGSTAGDSTSITLQAGQSFFLGDPTNTPNPLPRGARAVVNSGATIQGSSTLQVKFVVGDPGANFETRGLSAFPRGYWTEDYYAPVGNFNALQGRTTITDIFLYNPHTSAITINWENRTTTGSFSINAGATISFRAAAGVAAIPVGGGVYLHGTDDFWGVSTVDSTGQVNEWAYSLLPTTLLYDQHYLGWALGGNPSENGGTGDGTVGNDSGVFITPVQDNTRIFVDTNNDGTPEQTYTLNRLQTQYVYDQGDGVLSGTHFWATGLFTMSFGQNPATAPTQALSGDLGYVSLPGTDFVQSVIGVDKSASPTVVPTTVGATTTFTLTVSTTKYPIDTLTVVDTLPPDWQYAAGTTTISFPNATTSNANPSITGAGTVANPYVLTWSGLGAMAANQQLVITYNASTTSALAAGTLSLNRVEAEATRTFFGVTQTFNAAAFAYVASGDLTIDKTSSPQVCNPTCAPPLYPGDPLAYSVLVGNPSTTVTQTAVSLYDAIPAGLSYTAGSGQVSCELAGGSRNVQDQFASAAYNLNTGNVNWASSWTETDAQGGGAASGLAQVTGGVLRLAGNGTEQNVRDEFASAAYNNNGPNNTNSWTGDWAETDTAGAGAGSGFARITGGHFEFRYPTSTVRDEFTTAAYNNNNGPDNWATSWTEGPFAGADGSAATVADQQIYITGGRLRLDRSNSATNFYVRRSVSITGTGPTPVTVSFVPYDSGIDAGEAVQAEYSVNGGTSFTNLGTAFDGGTAGWGGVPQTFPVTVTAPATLILQFRATSIWNSNNDHMEVDDVQVSYPLTSSPNAVGTLISRTANLAGAPAATLSFSYTASGLESGDTVVVEASTDGTNFTILQTLAGVTGTNVGRTYDLLAPTNLISASTSIRFRVAGGFDDGNDLFQIDDVDITYGTAPTTAVQRTADLSLASGPALTFTAATANLETGDTLVVEASSSASGPFTVLASYSGGTPSAPQPFDLSPYASSTTTVRFRLTQGYGFANETFSLDNVDISYGLLSTFAAGAPPDFLAASTACTIRPRGLLRLTYSTTVDSSFSDDLNPVVNTAATTTAQLPVQIRDSVTNLVTVPARQSASVAGRVWFDADGGADQDVGEPGFANVEVVLKDQFGTPIATAYTDANGRFLFPGVEPGNGYYVESESGVPGGLCETFPTACTPPSTNVNRSSAFNLSAGQNYDQADIGYKPATGTAAFGDLVWVDANSNGVRDLGEPGFGGRTVLLHRDTNGDGILQPCTVPPACTGTDLLVASTTSAADGSYLFAGQTTGSTYFVSTAIPSGYIPTTDTLFRFLNVTAGSYLTADFGFAGSTTPTFTLSDRVWLDADGQGDFDEGSSSGIGGVTVDLLDASQNVIATTVTAADGTFSFAGLTGSSADYTTRLTDASGVLTSYTGTTSYAQAGQRGETNLTADRDRRNNSLQGPPSYGFVPTRSIGDTVWYDNDADSVQDPGELGIPGVLVTLYPDLNGDGAIDLAAGTGTVTTNGTAVVTGTGTAFLNYHAGEPIIIGGVLYTIQSVTDATHLTLTTTVPTATNVAFTAHSAGPGTVTVGVGSASVTGSGTMFTSYRAGDPITIAGVQYTIQSIASDTSLTLATNATVAATGGTFYGPGVIGSVTTDAGGHYLFSGLKNGNYVVSTPTPAGLTYTGTDGAVLLADDDPTAPGAQLRATISGTGNVLDRDFGFQAPPLQQRTLGGILWRDNDADGVIDVGEPRFPGVTVDVYSDANSDGIVNGTDALIATVITDDTGTYAVSGLMSGATYRVVVTDVSGILAGTTATYEKTEGACSSSCSFNNREFVTLTSSVADVNFGYRRTLAPTYASIADLSAFVSDGAVVVEWRTSAEVGTVGFHLLRQDAASGEYRQVNAKLLPGLIVHPEGGSYRFRDEQAAHDGSLTYKLVEVDVRGERLEYGPYTVTPASGVRRASEIPEASWTRGAAYQRQPAIPSRSHLELARAVAVQRANAAARGTSQPSSTVKVTTHEPGLHYLSAARLAAAAGVSPEQVSRWIRARQLEMSSRGHVVRYLHAGSGQAGGTPGLYFYAEPAASIYTDDNVYWVNVQRRGSSMSMTTLPGSGALASTFTETVTHEQDNTPGVTFAHDPDADFWNWDYVFAGDPGLDTKAFVGRVSGVAGSGQATLTVHLQGGNVGVRDHHVVISWNGTPVGQSSWAGTQPHIVEIPLSGADILDGDNTLGLTALLDGGDQSIVFLDSFDVTYQRTYRAEADSLQFTLAPGSAAEVGGFSAGSVLVLDVTSPAQPALATGYSIDLAADGTYRVSLAAPADGGDRRYLAVLSSLAKEPPTVTAWHSSGLRDTTNAAEYVLVAPDVLEAAAQDLAAYRNGRGITTRVVGLQAVYDEFADGIPSPLAIRSFLQYATTSWQTAPRHATLVGRGTWDYKNRWGVGDNLVPAALVATPHGLAPSDARLADLVGDDGVPDIGIGRLPFLSAQEAQDYLAKVQQHEAAPFAKWQRRLMVVADNPDGGGNFTADSDQVAGLVPAGHRVDKVYLGSMDLATARQSILDAINQGVLFFNYVGHGGLDRLASEGMLTSDDVPLLTNGSRLPAFVATTCLAGDYGIPGFRSLGEHLLLHPAGGAYAVFGPSWLSEDDAAVRLDGALVRQIFVGQERVFGEAARKALSELEVGPQQEYIRSTYHLLGEPVSRLP
jgi:hypothetical protein